MRKALQSLVLVSALLGFAGCGGGGGLDPAAIALQLQGCTGAGLLNFYAMLLRLNAVGTHLEGGTPPAGYTVITNQQASPPNSFSYEVRIDSDLDGDDDVIYTGIATFSDDPFDGLDPNATIDATVNMTGPGGATGSGTISARLVSDTQFTVSGDYTDGAAGCTATFTIDSIAPVVVFTPGAGPAPATLQGGTPIGVVGMTGSMAALVDAAGHSLSAILNLAAGTSLIGFTNLEIDNVGVPDDTFDGLVSTPQILAAIDCMQTMMGGLFEVGSAFEEILNAIRQGQTTTPDGDFSFNPLTGAFTTSFDDGTGVLVTISGTVSFSPLPTTTFYTGTASVTFNLTTDDDSLSGSSLPGQPFVAVFDAGDLAQFYAGATFTEAAGDCTGTIQIPASNPLEDGQSSLGIANIDATVAGIDIVIQILFSPNGVVVGSATINGIAVPPELIPALVG